MARWNGGPDFLPSRGGYMFRLKDSGGLRGAGKRGWSKPLPPWAILFGIFVGMVFGGCSSGPTVSSLGFLNALGDHPEGWVTSHPAFALPDGSDCTECHGSVTDAAQSGGIANVSCFIASRNGVGCHANGPSFQSLNMLNEAGGNFPGTALTDNEPFPTAFHPTGWANPDAHGASDTGNAEACAHCHLGGGSVVITPPSPVPAEITPGCFNNTLCHG